MWSPPRMAVAWIFGENLGGCGVRVELRDRGEGKCTSGSDVKVPVTTSTYIKLEPVAIVPMDV